MGGWVKRKLMEKSNVNVRNEETVNETRAGSYMRLWSSGSVMNESHDRDMNSFLPNRKTSVHYVHSSLVYLPLQKQSIVVDI